MNASEAVLTPTALQQWAATMYDLHVSMRNARNFVVQFAHSKKRRLSEYNLRLSLKWQLIPLARGECAPFPRPISNPNRVDYPLDNYARAGNVTMASLLAGTGRVSAWQSIAIRHLEDIGGYVGETHFIIELQRSNSH